MPSVYVVMPMSAGAVEWMKENIQCESWQRMGNGIAVEHGYIGEIVAGMMEEGLKEDLDFELIY